jgi:hypothetical protein
MKDKEEIPGWPLVSKKLPHTIGTRLAKWLSPELINQHEVFASLLIVIGVLALIIACLDVFYSSGSVPPRGVLAAIFAPLGVAVIWFGVRVWLMAPDSYSPDVLLSPVDPEPFHPRWLYVVWRDLSRMLYGRFCRESAWRNKAGALLHSPDPLEREHFFVGTFADPAIPVVRWCFGLFIATSRQFKHIPALLHEKLLQHGVLITGAIGSGKTMIGMLSIVLQLLWRNQTRVILLDLKGDDNLFKLFIRSFACKWFSSNRRRWTWVWNPFADSLFLALCAAEKGQVLVRGLGGYFGEIYGATYFQKEMEIVAQRAFEFCKIILSYAALLVVIQDKEFRSKAKLSQKEIDAAAHLVAALIQISSVGQLNVTEGEAFENRIDLGEEIETPGLTIFSLPIGVDPMAAKSVARTVSQLLNFGTRDRSGGTKVYLCIDECQEWIDVTMVSILRTSRDAGSGLHLVMALQNLSDLDTPNGKFKDVVTGNCAIQQTFTAMDVAGRSRLEAIGGEKITHLNSTTTTSSVTGADVVSKTVSERVTKIFDPNTINDLNSTQGLCVLEAVPHSEFTCLTNNAQFVQAPFPIPRSTFDEIARSPLPWGDNPCTIRGIDVVVDQPRDDDEDGAAPVPAPKPPPPPSTNGAKKPKRRRGGRKLTPEEEAQARADAELLKKLAGQ